MATVDNSANKENDTKISNNTDSTIKTTSTTINTNDKKEEEPIHSPSTNTTKSDNNNNESESNSLKLLTEAKELMELNKYEEASTLCSSALSIIQTQNTNQAITSIDCAQYYMVYGQSLLRLIQSSNDLFGEAVKNSQKKHAAAAAEEAEAPLITDASDDNINSKQEKDEDDDIAPVEPEAPEPEPEAAPVAGGDVEDREIAWESLEYARVILEDYLNISGNENNNKYIRMLGLTHSFLGELSIEDENNENALKDFETALELYNKCDDGIIEYRQISFDRFMACLASQFTGDNNKAIEHCNIALKQLSLKIIKLLNGFHIIESECKENEYNNLYNITNKFIEKMENNKKESKNGKELCDLNRSMNDLICKKTEIKEIIEAEKNNEGKDNNNNNVPVMGNNDDPLAALINGLTSKFGINQEQLDEFDKMDMNNDDTTNKKDEGITTIGFGNNNNGGCGDNDEQIVNELGSFGGSKCNKNKRKRTMDEAGIDQDDAMDGKKVKLNSGAAIIVEKKEEK